MFAPHSDEKLPGVRTLFRLAAAMAVREAAQVAEAESTKNSVTRVQEPVNKASENVGSWTLLWRALIAFGRWGPVTQTLLQNIMLFALQECSSSPTWSFFRNCFTGMRNQPFQR